MSHHLGGLLLATGVVLAPAFARAQLPELPPPRPPIVFSEFAGTWARDTTAGAGHIAGLPLPNIISISVSSTRIEVKKNSDRLPEVYRLDATQTDLGDGRVASFILVGDSIALTTKRTRQQTAPSRERGPFTNVITDVYSVAGDVLTLERKLSVVRADALTVL